MPNLRSMIVLSVVFLLFPASAQSLRKVWPNGPPTSPSYFPIGVYLQNPSEATWFRSLGINLYVGLWEGPTAVQLAKLRSAGMQAIVAQNAVGLADTGGTIVGWLQVEEPDNAQPNGVGGYSAPIEPDVIAASNMALKAADPTRPVLIDLGRGVAWDGWYGRKSRTNHPEDYPRYLEGVDIASFDIYPMASPKAAIHGQLWRVGHGVRRLRRWSKHGTPVWSFIETGNINGTGGATPAQVRAETFGAIIAGASGILYFVHQLAPVFKENQLRADQPMAASIAATNAQIASLAPIINAEPGPAQARVVSPGLRIEFMRRDIVGATYLFAVNLDAGEGKVRFDLDALEGQRKAEVIGEGRQLAVVDGALSDRFEPYQVHIFMVKPPL